MKQEKIPVWFNVWKIVHFFCYKLLIVLTCLFTIFSAQYLPYWTNLNTGGLLCHFNLAIIAYMSCYIVMYLTKHWKFIRPWGPKCPQAIQMKFSCIYSKINMTSHKFKNLLVNCHTSYKFIKKEKHVSILIV